MFNNLIVKDIVECKAGGYLSTGAGIIYYSFLLGEANCEFIPSK